MAQRERARARFWHTIHTDGRTSSTPYSEPGEYQHGGSRGVIGEELTPEQLKQKWESDPTQDSPAPGDGPIAVGRR